MKATVPNNTDVDPRTNTIVYLSGPMQGCIENNYETFNVFAAKWRAHGWTVINPAENFGGAQNVARNTQLKNDYSQLIQHATAIALMPNWLISTGAITEAMIATSLKYTVYDAEQPGMLMDMAPYRLGVEIQDRTYPEPTTTVKATSPPIMGTESVCQIADRLVSVDRQNDYGHPRDDFQRIADMATGAGFRVIESNGNLRNIQPKDHVFWMQFTKLSREINNHKRDNLIDGAGYWKTLDLIHDMK